ncbi:MAG: YiiX/YebB-like N1pC/P60 family cysteine hydrolase [Pirellulaceae bacterium]
MDDDSLVEGARAVCQIAAHFTELKTRATELTAAARAQHRGYFVPEEGLEVMSILASYWSGRNALLELIHDYRTDFAADGPPKDIAFLTAFSAALVLVDAARYLRESFHDLELVRAKLNEAAEEFGIPAGSYDQVQRSLFDPRHAWHLYHAIHYFQANRDLLEKQCSQPPFASLWSVVTSLEHRLDVPISRYARASLRARGAALTRRLTLTLLQRSMYGLQKLAGLLLAEKYVRLGHEPNLQEDIRRQLAEILRPGDLLVVRKEFAITNYFLPGYWPHAALYLGGVGELDALGIPRVDSVSKQWTRIANSVDDVKPLTVLESMKDGVHLRSLDSPYRCDSIVVLRLPLPPEDIATGLARALAHEGKPYDFSFDFRRADQLVCTEVAFRGFEGVGGVHFPLVRRAGRPTLSGSDLIQLATAGDVLSPVAVYAPRLSHGNNGVIRGDACRAVLKEVSQ